MESNNVVLEKIHKKSGEPYTLYQYVKKCLVNLGFCSENDELPNLNDRTFIDTSKEIYKKIGDNDNFQKKYSAIIEDIRKLSLDDFSKIEESGLARFLVEVAGGKYIPIDTGNKSDVIEKEKSENLEEHELNKGIIQRENIENINEIDEKKSESSKFIEQINLGSKIQLESNIINNENIDNEINEIHEFNEIKSNAKNTGEKIIGGGGLNINFIENKIVENNDDTNNNTDESFGFANEIKLGNEIKLDTKVDEKTLEKKHKSGEHYTVPEYQKQCLVNLRLCRKDDNVINFKDSNFINICKANYKSMCDDMNATKFQDGAKGVFDDMSKLSDTDFAKVGKDDFYNFLLQVAGAEGMPNELYEKMCKFLETNNQIQPGSEKKLRLIENEINEDNEDSVGDKLNTNIIDTNEIKSTIRINEEDEKEESQNKIKSQVRKTKYKSKYNRKNGDKDNTGYDREYDRDAGQDRSFNNCITF